VSVEQIFRKLQRALESAGIPYMITGSFASSAFGEPRASKDIDIVIAPNREQLIELLRHFPTEQYQAEEEEALEAFAHQSMFYIIDYSTGWRVDLILKKTRPFSNEEFSRRAELEWAKLGESQRQLEDAAGIIRVQSANLDTSYVERWVRELGLMEQWLAAKARAG
jgi:hypothetical protein